MKRLAQAITLGSIAALLSGCIVVPARHGGCRAEGPPGGYHGSAYVQQGGLR